MKEFYQNVTFRGERAELLEHVSEILAEYVHLGFKLTVRQLYYQLVARDIIPNTERSYKNTTRLVNDGRLAGVLDWDMIEDRTREFDYRSRWSSPQQIVEACAAQFHMDMWETQPCRVFAIIEKEALVSVIERTCRKYDVPMLAARGYPSVSVLREFAEKELVGCDQTIVILHMGDHDPSGIDMTRDLEDRLRLLSHGQEDFQVRRIALNMPQIEELKPPPNPAKTTDARFDSYRRLYGNQSWELDALPPTYLETLLTANITQYIDDDEWQTREEQIFEARKAIQEAADNL